MVSAVNETRSLHKRHNTSPPSSVTLLLKTLFQCEFKNLVNTDCIRRFPHSYFKEWVYQRRATTTSSADPVSMTSLRWSRVIWNDREWPVTSEHAYGETDKLHKEILPHPMSRLELGTSQTLNSGICYGKRKSPTRSSWSADADEYDKRHNYSYIVLRE
jgi:hypothetical protein